VPSKNRKLYVIILCATSAILLFGGYIVLVFLVDPTVLPQQAIHLLPDAVLPQQGQRALIFSPHPDDETIGVGGYIAQSTQQGADVRIVLVTDGNKHHNEDVRYEEFKKATAILGVNESNLVFMGFPDGTLREQSESMLYQRLKEQIDTYNPDILIYPCQQDFHPDHATIGRILNGIVSGSNSKMIVFQYLVHYEFYYPRPKKLAPALYLLPPSRLVRFGNGWQKVILAQSIEGLKQEAIYTYHSQLSNPLLKELLLSSIRKNDLLLAR
jgi:N-acetylglucosamine malate deacetylase 1